MAAYSEDGISRRMLLGGTAGAGMLVALPLGNEVQAMDDGMWADDGLLAHGRDEPRVHPRQAWEARPPRQRAQVVERGPDRIIVHHTATMNSKDYSLNQAYRLSRLIQRFHMQDRGWDDIGEQLTISRGGYVMEGRNRTLSAIKAGRHVIGAQMRGHNGHTIGIENEGTYNDTSVPVQLWAALVDTCVWLCETYGLNPHRAIRGHRDFGDTDCPGEALYERLPELRNEVAGRLKGDDRESIDLNAPKSDPLPSLLPEAPHVGGRSEDLSPAPHGPGTMP
ncbi:peptidoglycan recognition protein family protein [Thermomonospora umbrina]|uniref:N-acetylmuramoyl-L-alanine amidase n=1 Tax=Thermomonospora umbrina TaxID=111806 RepID=A0A3D9SMT0_9ACTN|nr:peptidoglycan recognition family protein [Thermomonospora umbrina]REE97232.1 N-acetylmuramoyl-L-alanine amidase [Thermomonospora umbrina]